MSDPLERLKTELADRYAIEREVGSGGMATVYLAEDIKHHRQVAIKVLRPDLAATLGPERFLREIEVAARLQHPHILPLHDSGETHGFLYYVMPFVEGQSLRDKLAKEGELPIGEAVRIIRDVVDALTEAHANGVVHRDIKPENILLRGRHALVTDFGVAKAVSEATGREKLTTAGIALGTPAYMAPEQASADPHLDHRVDIYAVGAVAYEILTGRPVFMGTTPQQILTAHVTEAPQPLRRHRETVPAALESMVMRCLEKKPADRWQSAEELLPQLETLATPSGGMTPTQTAPVSSVPRPRAGRAARIAAVAGVMAIIGFFGWKTLRPGPPEISVTNIRPLTRAPEVELHPAISPDGGDVVYASGDGIDFHLYVRDVGGGRALPLTVDRPGVQLFPQWTADGRSVVFLDIGPEELALHQIPRLGGPTQQIVALGVHRYQVRWHTYHEGRLAFVRGDSLLVRDLDSDGVGFVARVAPKLHSLVWSPDGALMAYVEGNHQFSSPPSLGNVAPSTIWTVPTEGGDPVRVTQSLSLNMSPVWTPDGRQLLFISDRDGPRGLYAIRLDDTGHPRGEPVRVEAGLDAHSLSLSADGRSLAYSSFTLRRNIVRVALPTTGPISIAEATAVTVGNQTVEGLSLSPDGHWLAYDSDLEGNQDIYLMANDGGEPRRLTTDPADDYGPHFSPDGRQIAFYSNRNGTRDIFVMSADGGNVTRLTDDPGQDYWPTFSPDGLHLMFHRVSAEAVDLYLMRRDAVGEAWDAPQLLAEDGSFGLWSPDGQRIAFSSEAGELGLRLTTPDGRGRESVDLPIGMQLILLLGWSPDGRALRFFGTNEIGESGLYQVTTGDGSLRLLIRGDDPTRTLTTGLGSAASESGEVLYLSVAEFESDIHLAELEIR